MINPQKTPIFTELLIKPFKIMKNILQKCIGMMALCILATSVYAQVSPKKFKKAKGIEVTYQNSYKGKVRPGEMIMKVSGDQVALETVFQKPQGKKGKKDLPAPKPENKPDAKRLITKNYVDYAAKEFYRWSELPNGDIISAATPFEFGQNLTEIGTDKYLGLNCKILRTSINSNTIEIWYTNDIAFRGTPQAGVGVPDGLVLRVIRNGETIQEATAITPIKEERTLLPESWGKKLDASDYQYAINQSGVITIPIFDQQTICFNGAKLPETLENDVIYSAGGGAIILKKVKLPENVKHRSIFVEAVQYSDGDAYDRTGSIFVIPTDKKQSFIDAIRDLKSVPSFTAGNDQYHGLVSTPEYDVPVELMRFFTGFGVRKFNHVKVPGQVWVDSVLYKSEVTALADHLHGEAWIGAYIGNWDTKGHKLSLKLKYYPDGGRRMYKAMPLFNTTNLLEQAGQPYPIFMLNNKLNAKFV